MLLPNVCPKYVSVSVVVPAVYFRCTSVSVSVGIGTKHVHLSRWWHRRRALKSMSTLVIGSMQLLRLAASTPVAAWKSTLCNTCNHVH